jgi:hypothetical protein
VGGRHFFLVIVSLFNDTVSIETTCRRIDECGAVGGMGTGKGNRSTRRKPASQSLCPPQSPHDLTWD